MCTTINKKAQHAAYLDSANWCLKWAKVFANSAEYKSEARRYIKLARDLRTA